MGPACLPGSTRIMLVHLFRRCFKGTGLGCRVRGLPALHSSGYGYAAARVRTTPRRPRTERNCQLQLAAAAPLDAAADRKVTIIH